MLEIGSLVDGKYKILSEIGHGGMSVVYMALNEKANKTWAVKVVRKDGQMDLNSVRQGLIAETNTLKRLDHPHLPSIVDVIEDDESFIIVMDYVQGRSLDKIINETGAQSEEDVVEWAKQLCDVFAYLHSQDPPIIYRDMKPANIMLKPDGDITVIDFGTAKNYEFNVGETTGIGTVGYAAPEQFHGCGMGRTDPRTDIYCLGMTLYHLLTNVSPCENIIATKSIRAVNPSLSRGLDKIILKCTEVNPNDRYQSCAELLYDLENYEALEPIYKKKQKNKLMMFLTTVIMTVVFVIAGIGFNMMGSKMATDTYATKLDEAGKTQNIETRIQMYQECIEIPDKAGEKEAYLGLINAFKEEDAANDISSKFTNDEAELLTKLVKNNKAEIMKNKENYVEICFEIGKLYWYYYDYGNTSDNQVTRAKSSVEWFTDVVNNAEKDYPNLTMATVYANIGSFYRDITTNITEASDKGKYKPLFENFVKLIDTVAVNENESEIVRLELLELTRSAIHQYATKLKVDGVTYDEVAAVCVKIQNITMSIETTTDKTSEKRATTLRLLPDTLDTVKAAYSTDRRNMR